MAAVSSLHPKPYQVQSLPKQGKHSTSNLTSQRAIKFAHLGTRLPNLWNAENNNNMLLLREVQTHDCPWSLVRLVVSAPTDHHPFQEAKKKTTARGESDITQLLKPSFKPRETRRLSPGIGRNPAPTMNTFECTKNASVTMWRGMAHIRTQKLHRSSTP